MIASQAAAHLIIRAITPSRDGPWRGDNCCEPTLRHPTAVWSCCSSRTPFNLEQPWFRLALWCGAVALQCCRVALLYICWLCVQHGVQLVGVFVCLDIAYTAVLLNLVRGLLNLVHVYLQLYVGSAVSRSLVLFYFI